MDSSLTHGDGWIMCTICGEIHYAPYPNLVVDEDNVIWDVCKGECSIGAGIKEK